MFARGTLGFTRIPTRSEQYEILARLIDAAQSPTERVRLAVSCRVSDAFFATLLRGDFSHWSPDPVAPLALDSWLTLDRLYEWCTAGFQPTLTELCEGLRRTCWWQPQISELVVATYWCWFALTYAHEIPTLSAATSATTWQLAIHPLPQALVTAQRHEAAFVVSVQAATTGNILAYRLVPSSGLREAPYHVVHDALALTKEKPRELRVEQRPTHVFTRMVKHLGISLQLVPPQPSPWEAWSRACGTTTWSVQRMYRSFGQCLEQMQGTDPFQTLLEHHDVFAATARDPAWGNPSLQRCLTETKTSVANNRQVRFGTRIYRAYLDDPPLPPAGTPISLRLASLSPQYGWVWVADYPHTRVYQTTAPNDGKYIRVLRGWE